MFFTRFMQTLSKVSAGIFSWSATSTQPVGLNYYSIAYGAGVFVAVANGTTSYSTTSNGGATWVQRTLPINNAWCITLSGNVA